MSLAHRALARVTGSSDVVLGALALCAVAFLVAPLPPWLVDLAAAVNLALAATVLVVALFSRDALRFASFPTLLLFTTLLRLSVEVSSTRLILARGEAGRIVQAFGTVVVSGSYVVGAVVFAILTLVQLLVVAKGAERVAEVAARFTLDALPGKQMSIDAELRSGALDQTEARRRRRALEREGQLYGAMDGALKFVKGDALAGALIVLVNVAGGLAAGLARGLTLEAAARRYALLAIGDGLVAQIPALLVSVAAGVVVTRVSAEEEGRALAADLGRELFSDPRVLWTVAGLCVVLALTPGLPAAPFLALAGAAGVAARCAARHRRSTSTARDTQAQVVPAVRAGVPAPTPLVLELAPDLAELALAGAEGFAQAALPALRDELARELGVPIPSVDVRSGPLAEGAWRLLLEGVPAAHGSAPASEAVALVPPRELVPLGIAAVRELDPLTGAELGRIAVRDVPRVRALAPVRGPLERLGAGVAAALRGNAHLLVGVQEAQALLDELEQSHPALVREVTRQIPPHLLAEVLRRLLEEGVAVRPLRHVLEALLEGGGAPVGAAALTERCRRSLRRQIAHLHAGPGALEALLLDPEAEGLLREAAGGGIEPHVAQALVAEIARELSSVEGLARPVLLTTAEIRRSLRQLVAPRFPRLAVLSYEELPEALPVHPVGKVVIARS